MENNNFKCIKVDFADYAEEIGALRRKSWETVEGFDPIAFPENIWIDDLDTNAIHWAVFDNKKIIASARLGLYSSFNDIPYMDMMNPYQSLLKLPVASLNRLVVSIDYRGQNISPLLDKIRVDEAAKMNAKTIVGQAVSSRINGLKRLGFEFIADIGSIKELPKINLCLMVKHL